MKRSKLFAALLCSASMVLGGVTPAMADAMRVVTLGADLTEEQKQTMMRYFKVNADEVEVLYITNQDERDQLGSYVPLEQIGSRTVSCAYVRPTTSGGIKVRTANLNWVTGNMIATTLSTSGVKNCEVIAACPFEVSGTGALTGIQMAYEKASGEKLDETKKEIATEEFVVTGQLADEVGKNTATDVINQAKMEVVGNNIQNADEIYNMVTSIVQENNVSIDTEQLDQIVALLEQIAQQGYEYEDMQETLEQVDQNVSESEEAAQAETVVEEEVQEVEDIEEVPEDPDSILGDVDDSILGDDVIASSTEDPNLEVETGATTETPEEEEWDDTVIETTEPGTEEPTPAEGETPVEGEAPAEEELDVMQLSEQAQSMFYKAKDFCLGEFEGDTAALQTAMEDETAVPSAVLDTELGKKVSAEIQKIYYNILKDGTLSFVPDGTEVYMNAELNMLQTELEKFFGIETEEEAQAAEVSETAEEDLLKDVTAEDKEALYKDTMKFFELVYGETTESVAVDTETIPAEETTGEAAQEPAEEAYAEDTSAEVSYEEEGTYTEDVSYEDDGMYEEETYYYE